MRNRTIAALGLAAALTLAAAPVVAAHTQQDWTTTLKVKLALLEKLGTDGLNVDVDTNGGAVRLGGTVEKRQTAELATTIARSVEGVGSVDNDLEVEAAPGAGTVGAAATEVEAEVKDAVLESRVRLALIDRLGSDGLEIETEAASGVVTLGFPATLAADRRSDAKAAAGAVSGVLKVVSIEKN